MKSMPTAAFRRTARAVCTCALTAALSQWFPAAYAAAAQPVTAQAPAAQRAAAQPAAVAWRRAVGDADIEQAFAQARGEGKPVLLYWGATWCPPCNQLKATLFNRHDFIERSKALVPVELDGDQPGAQRLAARFKVRGYPTMILLAPDGAEITRLPGEAEAKQVIAMLQRGQGGGRPVKALLADARVGKPLAAGEWRALALYAWDVDEEQLVAEPDRPALLAQLAANCPRSEAESSARLLLKALAATTESAGLKSDAGLRERVRRLLRDPAAARAQMDVLVNFAPEIAKALAPEPGRDRQATVAALGAALRQLQADATLSRGDRLSALVGRVELARLGLPRDERHPKLGAALQGEVREFAARADREIGDPYERQAVITGAAHALAQAGLWSESDALLKANLARSHSPYYLMSQLGGNARKLGRDDEALDWYRRAFEASVGPATRLQWGAGYLSALVDLAPDDATRIEQIAAQLIAEAAQDPAAFYERSARALQRAGAKLAGWNAEGRHAAPIERLNRQLSTVCGRLPSADAQRATCESIARAFAPRSA
jgi:thioredoxin-like negative regulator of GroEL